MAMPVQHDTDHFEVEPCGVGPPADRDQHDIGRERLPLGAVELQGQLVLPLVDRRDLGAEPEFYSRSREQALQRRAELAVHGRDDVVERLDHGNFGAEPLPHRAELEPDIAAADDGEPTRHVVERQGAGRRDDALLVDIDAG